MLMQEQGGGVEGLGGVLVLIFGLILYLLPTIIGTRRKVPNIGSVFVLNLFLGWTLIGWVIALAMAARTVPQTTKPPSPGGERPVL